MVFDLQINEASQTRDLTEGEGFTTPCLWDGEDIFTNFNFYGLCAFFGFS